MLIKIIGPIENIETLQRVAVSVTNAQLVLRYGGKNWFKRKGNAKVEIDGQAALAEVHWYECHGIGKVKMKVKKWL